MTNYKRIIIKVSGESLSGGKHGIDNKSVQKLAKELGEIVKLGVQVGVVVGGGNFWRGRTSDTMDRSVADSIGMMATVMNGLALAEALSACGVSNKVVSSIGIDKVVEQYNFAKVNDYLNNGNLVVFVGGTGLPYFSTDTTLALRACEIHADALFFMKNIDGIYDSDPKTNPNAKKYDEITFDKILADNLQAMDMTAIAMCREYGMEAIALGMNEKDGILRVLKG
ncbi:MAG: UMP kinase, partial [Clostridia bacterium]|nr:UMP kinase [Clostridia bacterium]